MNKPPDEKLLNGYGYNLTERTFVLFCISVCLVSHFFLFGPFNIYQGNLDEFSLHLFSVFTFFILPSLILTCILISIGFLLPKKLYTLYVSIIFAINILGWLQGNVFVWEYGVLDGTAINWRSGIWRGWVDASIWLLVLITAVKYYRRIYKFTAYVSIILFFIQFSILLFTGIQKTEIWEKKELPSNVEPEEIYQLSTQQNVIHIMVDSFQSDIFNEIIDNDPQYYSDMDGFVFFKEATSVHTCTFLSVPSFFTGSRYTNDMPMSDFIRMAVGKGENIPYALRNNGYEIDIINSPIPHKYYEFQCDNTWYSGVPYRKGKEASLKISESIYLLDLTLFRYVPHFIKRFIYRNQTWFLSSFFEDHDYERHPYFAYTSFFQDFTDNMIVKRSQPVYKFINLVTPHIPLVVNSDCEYAGEVLPLTRENVFIQSKCVLDFIVKFIYKLKMLGVYDSSLIIINADHGFFLPFQFRDEDEQSSIRASTENGFGDYGQYLGRLLPLMAIKPPYVKGLLSITDEQVELTDIPATINDILNLDQVFSGQSVFSDDSKVRKRKSFWNQLSQEDKKNDFLDHYREVNINGSIFDSTSWQWDEVVYFNSANKHEPVLPMESPLASKTRYNIESINDYRRPYGQTISIAENQIITIKGWAVDLLSGELAGNVYIDIDGKLFHTIYGKSRPDVAEFLNDQKFQYSGYKGEIAASEIGKGHHTLSLKILTNDKKAYYDTALKIEMDIM